MSDPACIPAIPNPDLAASHTGTRLADLGYAPGTLGPDMSDCHLPNIAGLPELVIADFEMAPGDYLTVKSCSIADLEAAGEIVLELQRSGADPWLTLLETTAISCNLMRRDSNFRSFIAACAWQAEEKSLGTATPSGIS